MTSCNNATMNEEMEAKLVDITYRLIAMTFALDGCCKYYVGEKIDPSEFIALTELIHKTAQELYSVL